jgi:hypothetical protein
VPDRVPVPALGTLWGCIGHHGDMSVLDDFAAARPEDIVRRGNEWFLDVAAVPDLIAQARERDVKVLGLEGFLIGEGGTYPALSRIADFSKDSTDVAWRRAIALLDGEWAAPPIPADQMHSKAAGRYMIAVVLAG